MVGQKIINTKDFYSEEFKLKVIHEVLQGQITKAQANRKYGIKGHSRVLTWIKKYQKKDEEKFGGIKNSSYIAPEKDVAMAKNKVIGFEHLKEENDRLKQELSFASMRVIALETMIDIAEKELKINIRKKCFTKQSKKSDKEI